MTTPRANVLRTVLQVLVAVCLAIPSALALVPIADEHKGSVALVIGLAGAIVVIVTAVQNAIEASTGSALFRSPESGVELASDDPAVPPNPAGAPSVDPSRGPP